MSKKHILILLPLMVLASVMSYLAFQPQTDRAELSASSESEELITQQSTESAPLSLEEAYPHIIEPRSTLSSSLKPFGIESATVHQIVEATKTVYNLGRIPSGIRYNLIFEDLAQNQQRLQTLEFRLSPIERLKITRQGENWNAEKIVEQVDIQVVHFSGVVSSSLWESAKRADMDPNLIAELADVFGWEIDFAREVRLNDRWRLSVEQKFVKGSPVGWGSILAAEYENAGELHQAVLYRKDGEDIGYFDLKGESLRKMFLKSPIRFGRITSGFNLRRFHPILKTRRPHLGVDYAAPIGTPVRAVGDGVIKSAGWKGGGGKVVQIRHNSTYQTNYMHLNGFAKGIRTGSRVKQGQVIGYVGTTGMSTGPHLHFEFYQAGRYIDPLGKKFPSADPVPSSELAQFLTEAGPRLAQLPPWETAETFASRIAERENSLEAKQ